MDERYRRRDRVDENMTGRLEKVTIGVNLYCCSSSPSCAEISCFVMS